MSKLEDLILDYIPEANRERVTELKLAILEVVRECVPKELIFIDDTADMYEEIVAFNHAYNKCRDDINSKMGGL